MRSHFVKIFLVVGLLFSMQRINAQEPGLYFNLEDDYHPNGGVYVMQNIFFGFDGHGLIKESLPELQKVSKFLKAHPSYQVEIGGHTDYRGNYDYNTKLSEMRARMVVDWLLNDSIDAANVSYKGYGESKPYMVQPSDTAGCSHLEIGSVLAESTIKQWKETSKIECALQLNRRIEMKLINGGTVPAFNNKLVVHSVYFQLAKWDILPRSYGRVFEIAGILKAYPNYVFEVGAHTDCRGSSSYSIRLSQKRAESLKALLVQFGIHEKRLVAKGYEESQPLEFQGNELSCDYVSQFDADKQKVEELHQLNRRIEIKVLATDFVAP